MAQYELYSYFVSFDLFEINAMAISFDETLLFQRCNFWSLLVINVLESAGMSHV